MRRGHITTTAWLDDTRHEVEVEYTLPYGEPIGATILREVVRSEYTAHGDRLVYAPTARRGERLSDAEVDAHRDEWEALWAERMEEERYLQGAQS